MLCQIPKVKSPATTSSKMSMCVSHEGITNLRHTVSVAFPTGSILFSQRHVNCHTCEPYALCTPTATTVLDHTFNKEQTVVQAIDVPLIPAPQSHLV